MKKGIHPEEYRPVVFQDTSDGSTFLTRSTAKTDDTIKWEDGQEYPLVKVHISSSSHPFYTGKEKMLDIEGRVDRYKAKAAKAKALQKSKKKAKKSQPQADDNDSDADTKPTSRKIGAKPKPQTNKNKEKEDK